MLRNLSRTLLIAGAAWLAAAPALSAQSITADPIRGDVDGDGRVTAADGRIIADFLVGRPVPQGASVAERGDVNGDGKVTSVDAAIVRAYAAGRDVSRFRVGAPVDEMAAGRTNVKCVAQVRARTVECTSPSGAPDGARADLILGAQNVYVKLASSNIVVTRDPATGDTLFAFDVTVKNLLHQALGVDSTGAAAPIDVFFAAGPNTTSGVGATTVETGLVGGMFTKSGQTYYRYQGAALGPDHILMPNEVSSPANWVLRLDSTVKTFSFELAVNSPVRYKNGWVDVYTDTVPRPSSPYTVDSAAIAVGETLQLQDTVRNPLGKTVPGAPVSWSSSAPAVATVDAAGLVTPVANGVTTITATSGARTGTAVVTVRPGLPEFIVINPTTNGQTGTPGVAVGNPPSVTVQDHFHNPVPNISVTFTVTGGGGSVGGSPVVTGANGVATVGSWTLGSGPGTNTLQASASPAGATTPVTFTDYIPPTAGIDDSQVMGNTRLDSLIAPNVLANDATINGPGSTISVTSTDSITTVRLGKVKLSAGGALVYLPPAGITGRDSAQYTISDTHASATGWIKFAFVGKVWYVDNSGAAGNGRDVSPFASIAAAEAVAGVNDSILVLKGIGVTAGGTLKAGQLVYGQGSTAPFTTTLNGKPVTLLAPLSAPSIGAMTLGSDPTKGNTLRGFTSTGGITGSTFGTLTVSELAINNPSGQALSLNNGTLAGSFTSVQSGGGTNNVSLTSVGTTALDTLGASTDALSGATGDAFVISGGAGSFIYPGSITNSASLAVNVSGKAGGAVTFSGGINPAAAARGISVTSNTGGTVTFSGTAKKISSGAAAGVTLTGNTGATIAFTGGGLTIATTTGTPFTATGGGTVEVSGSGNTISATGAAARAVNLSGITLAANGIDFSTISSSGTTTASAFTATSVGGGGFTAGSLTVAGTTGGTSRGVELSSNSAPFTFTTVSIGGTGAEGIYLNGNTGAVAVNGGSVATTTGDALAVTGGNAGVTVAASLTKTTAGRVANVTSRTGGTTSVQGTLSCTGSCTGINASSNSGGTIGFSGATQTLTTGANAAVTLSSNTGATINFAGGALAITTTSGAGFNATGGGTVSVTGATNTINATSGGTAVNVSGTTIGGSGMSFRRVDATGSGTNGIVLSNTGSGPFTVSGDGASDLSNATRGRTTAKSGGGSIALGSGGTISGRSGDGVNLSSTGAVTLRNMVVSGGALDGIDATSVSGLVLDNLQVTGHANNRGVGATSTSGLKVFHSEISNNATSAGSGAAFLYNLHLTDVTGVDSISSSLLQNSYGFVVNVTNNSGTLNLLMNNTTVTGATNGIGIGVYPNGGSNVTANFQSDSIAAHSARGIQAATGTTTAATLNLTVNNSRFVNNFVAIDADHGSGGTNTFNITNNNLQATTGSSQAININRLADPSFTAFGLFQGTVSGNTIGTAGTANSGSDAGDGITVKTNGNGGITRISIVSNTIREVGQHGIGVSARDATTGHTLEARIEGNTVSNLEAGLGLDAINVLPGASNLDTGIVVCLNILNNNLTGIRNGLRVRQSGSPAAVETVRLHGWNGSDVKDTYFVNRNTSIVGGTAATSISATPTYVTGSCTTP